MVFLRPVVVRDAASSDRLSLDRYEQMLNGMRDAQPAPSSTMPINEGPVLPSAPVKN
jgi:general secretion pathway protein D